MAKEQSQKRIRGAGDLVTVATTKLFGETDCLDCKKREAAWNHWLPLSSPPPIRHTLAVEDGQPAILFNCSGAESAHVRKVVGHFYAWRMRPSGLHHPLVAIFAGTRMTEVVVKEAIESIKWRESPMPHNLNWVDSNDRAGGWAAMLERVNEMRNMLFGDTLLCIDVTSAARDFGYYYHAINAARDHWRTHAAALRSCGAAGLVRHGRRSWGYLGGVFALRIGVTLERNWRYMPGDDPDKWLSAMFKPSEAAAIAADFLGRQIDENELGRSLIAFQNAHP